MAESGAACGQSEARGKDQRAHSLRADLTELSLLYLSHSFFAGLQTITSLEMVTLRPPAALSAVLLFCVYCASGESTFVAPHLYVWTCTEPEKGE